MEKKQGYCKQDQLESVQIKKSLTVFMRIGLICRGRFGVDVCSSSSPRTLVYFNIVGKWNDIHFVLGLNHYTFKLE